MSAFTESFCFLGGRRSGKTAAVAQKAIELAVNAPDEQVLILCATPQGAADMLPRLVTCEGGACSKPLNIRVMLADELALEILQEPYAAKFGGCKPSLTDPFDEKIIFEDLRSTEYKNKRLRDVFNFLKGGWSNLADREADWLISVEEETVKQRIFDCLEFERAIMPCQVANFALRALEDSDELAARWRVAHVLCDNYTQMSYAQQELAQALAGRTFTLSANEDEANPAGAEFPYPEGVGEFLASHPGVQVEQLDGEGSAAGAGAGVGATAGAGAGAGAGAAMAPESEVYMGETMAHEMQRIAAECKQALDAGQTVMLVCENKKLLSNTAANLEKVGIATRKPQEGPRDWCRPADFADTEKCAGVRAAKLSMLARGVRTGSAMRALLACGNYTANSNAVEELRNVALKQGLSIEAALDALEAGTLELPAAKAALGETLRALHAQIRQDAAAKKASSEGPAASPATPSPQPAVQGDADSPSSPLHEVRAEAAPSPAVLVCAPAEAYDRQADVVIFSGFVNGIVPCREYLDQAGLVGRAKEREFEKHQRNIGVVSGAARQKLLFTGFTSAPIEVAEYLDLKIDNIKLRQGRRICKISPSIYLNQQ